MPGSEASWVAVQDESDEHGGQASLLASLSSPWVEGGCDEETRFQVHISDARRRWERCAPISIAPHPKSLQDAATCEDAILAVRLQDLHEKMQSKTANAVVKFHDDIIRMAKTLVEVLHFSTGEQNEVLEKQVADHMQKIRDRFTQQQQGLESLEKEYDLQLTRAVAQRAAAEGRTIAMLLGSGVCAMLSSAALAVIGLVPLQCATRFGFAIQWHAPVRKDQHGNISYGSNPCRTTLRPSWTCGMLVACASLCALGVGTAWRYSKAHLRKNLLDVLARKLGEYKQSATQHRMLWDGMNVSVERVADHVEELQRLGTGDERKLRKRDAIKEIFKALFDMYNAMDEFIVYVDESGYIPPNVSIQSLIGAVRYNAIRSAMLPNRNTSSSSIALAADAVATSL